MRKRIVGMVVAVSTALLLLPAAGQAQDSGSETTCANGSEPVQALFTNLSPVLKAQVRLLCVQD